jgi:hypothetical protein
MLFTTCQAKLNQSIEIPDTSILDDAITITMAGVSIQEKFLKKCKNGSFKNITG